MENRQKKNLENNADTSFSRLVWYGAYGIRTRDPHTARGFLTFSHPFATFRFLRKYVRFPSVPFLLLTLFLVPLVPS